ncbi:MAG: ATP-dependent helicase HrpB, partial [Parvularculaceae bacterium]
MTSAALSDLPIERKIPEIRAALAQLSRLVLAAPPGAGKTTRLPLALIDERWLGGARILLLEPRRIAARLAAERMASTLGEKVGETIGLSTRIDRRVSAATRIEVVTDGLTARRIIADPELHGVGAVLFDEFHERSLALDLGLALALDIQGALRPDLRLIVMSATLDTARIAARIAAPEITSDGRIHPVETVYLGRASDRVEEQIARAVRRALREREGSVLAFLPGQAEILRTVERLGDIDAMLAPLYGALSPAEQDAAVAPAPIGRRKVVLATDIAESSLTIPGVSIVIDAGLARVAYHDPEGGSRLTTERASRASVDQRRGRAGRIGPGVCYRLWDEAETRGLAAEPTPEILSADLSGFALTLAEWGVRDAARLTFIDPPPAGRLAAATAHLQELGALDASGSLTARGRDIARLPLAPQIATMIAGAAPGADRALAAEIAALLSERGLGGGDADIAERLRRFRADRSPRARALKSQAVRWAESDAPAAPEEAGRIIASALPSRIAKARSSEPGLYLLANGRAARLDSADALSASTYLVVADMIGSRTNARILAAARISEEEALALGGAATEDVARYDPATRSIRAKRVRRIGAIVLHETPLPKPPPAAARQALLAALGEL